VNILAKPESFDEGVLRKEFVKKLDEVAGKSKNSPQYREALKKIDENIKKLKELADYMILKAKVKEMSERYSKKLNIKNEVEYLIIAGDFREIERFEKLPKPFCWMYQSEQVYCPGGGKIK
jgi:hypothetical protein